MFKGQILKDLVNARLTAAAEEIFALFERTIAEYEEELCRSKEENQELLDSVLNPRVALHRTGVQIPSRSPGPGLNQVLTLQIKEEEEQLQLPESSAVSVKTEESSLLQQRQTEPREETQGEDISAETLLHMRNVQHGDTDNEEDTEHGDSDGDEDWRAPLSCSASQMETEANGDDHNQETSYAVNSDMSGRAKRTKTTHECPICQKIFHSPSTLQNHIRVHTGEKPYSCSVCKKRFTQKGNLDTHLKIHTGDKPFSCSTCKKVFSYKAYLDKHVRVHTGERPYVCPICKKGYIESSKMKRHMKTHRTECD